MQHLLLISHSMISSHPNTSLDYHQACVICSNTSIPTTQTGGWAKNISKPSHTASAYGHERRPDKYLPRKLDIRVPKARLNSIHRVLDCLESCYLESPWKAASVNVWIGERKHFPWSKWVVGGSGCFLNAVSNVLSGRKLPASQEDMWVNIFKQKNFRRIIFIVRNLYLSENLQPFKILILFRIFLYGVPWTCLVFSYKSLDFRWRKIFK